MGSNDNPRIRLNKFIATQLAIGRRQADVLIESGEVLINSKPARLGAQVNPKEDRITVRGTLLDRQGQALMYLLFNKPKGYVCSRQQQGDAPTIYSLLPQKYHHLKTVGRLDKDSSGLLLLTNDGDYAHQMTHPSFHKIKIYEVTLGKPLQPLHHQLINDRGIDLPDGKSQLSLSRLKEGDDLSWQVTMHEGRNRQIRRTFAALGYTVLRLHRTQFGPFTISQLDDAPYKEIAKVVL